MDSFTKAGVFLFLCLLLFAVINFLFPVLRAISGLIIKFCTFAARAAFRL